jgi:hypothetical protein
MDLIATFLDSLDLLYDLYGEPAGTASDAALSESGSASEATRAT